MSEFENELNDLGSMILKEKLAKMAERNDQRKAAENRRRKERFEFGSHAEQAEVFSETFKEYQRKIEIELNDASEAALAGENRSKLTIRLDNIFKIIDTLKRYMTESSMFLTAFDNEQAKIEYQEIMSKFNSMRDSLLPKKKFGFNTKSKTSNPSADPKPEVIVKAETKTKPIIDTCEFGFFNESNQTLRLNDDQINRKDLTLKNLSNCQVYLLGNPGSVYIHKITNCTIVCGPTNRSILIEDCNQSTFYFACQQGRIHNAHDCDFYIHVTCRAIIEDCDRVRFAPYLLQYENLTDDFQRSQLDTAINNWDKIDDFRHLSLDVASPNWTIVDETDRKLLSVN